LLEPKFVVQQEEDEKQIESPDEVKEQVGALFGTLCLDTVLQDLVDRYSDVDY
jgi:hypothetical protein